MINSANMQLLLFLLRDKPSGAAWSGLLRRSWCGDRRNMEQWDGNRLSRLPPGPRRRSWLLASWVRIPLESWMFVFVFLCCLVLCPLRRADHPSKGVLPCVVIRLLNLSVWGGQGLYKDCRATDNDETVITRRTQWTGRKISHFVHHESNLMSSWTKLGIFSVRGEGLIAQALARPKCCDL
jgi:hypothetical protein